MTTPASRPHTVTIHVPADDVEMTATKPSTVNVQPNTSSNNNKFRVVHINNDAYDSNSSASNRLPPVQISYSDIKFSIDIKKDKIIEKREILKGCSGTFNPGRLTAVMGASGAGKTSLMNIISGNPTAGERSGSICINGTEVSKEMGRLRELSAYIQQDDILMATQTVKEAVTLSARLRLPKSMSDEEKLKRVDEVIEMLGLTKCKDTIVGNAFNKGVSGGEKRRVSMALELIKSPAILFLDEPTSGLDTYTAHSIVGLLRDIAHTQGKTIVCTIHQPSSDIYWMFDDLVLMADGQIMYHGSAAHAVEYFNQRGMVCPENFNPADHLFTSVLYSMEEQLKMVTRDIVDEDEGNNEVGDLEKQQLINSDRETQKAALYDEMQKKEKARVQGLLKEWLSSDECNAITQEIKNPLKTALPDPSVMRAERPGELYAFQLLSARRWYDLLRDKMKVRVQFSQYIFFSLLLGLIFLRQSHSQNSIQNREGGLFFVCVQAMFMSFMSNLNSFGPEKLVMKREMESGMYGVSSFFFSRWIIEIPFRVIFPFFYAVILYFLFGFQATAEKFFLFYFTLMLIDNCGTNMAVMICSVFPEIQQAMQAGPAFVLPMMVFSGFYVNLKTLGWWFRWISYISPIRYGFSAVLQNEMNGLEFDCDPSAKVCTRTGEDALQLLGMDGDPSIGLNLVILLILLGGYLMGAYTFIWKSSRRK